MQKPLLTSSQVSVALSSVIVIICTLALFFAGYALQQQTLQNLHRTLRPQGPLPRHQTLENNHPILKSNHDISSRLSTKLSKPFRKLAQQIYLSREKEEQFDWSRLAHAQLVKNHEQVCDSLIIFHELHKQRSAAPKLLLFPRVWLEDKEGDAEMEASIRLIRKASRLYRVILVPISPLKKDSNKMDENSYSIASLFSLTDYDRVMMLSTPGLVLNAQPFDSMLAYYQPQDDLAIYPLENSMYLVRPNKTFFDSVSRNALETTISDQTIVNTISSRPESLLSDTDPDFKPTMYMTLEELRTLTTEGGFNATKFFDETAFIRIEDPALPGPEWEVPYKDIVKFHPKDPDQAFIWEKMYSLYKSRRYTVCGLDPKPLPVLDTEVESRNVDDNVTEEKDDL